MSKVKINNIKIKNPKAMFVDEIEMEIYFDVLGDLQDGLIIRFEFYGGLCWVC